MYNICTGLGMTHNCEEETEGEEESSTDCQGYPYFVQCPPQTTYIDIHNRTE